jgi:hypothetical protein
MVCVLLVGLLIGAVILRAAISFANKCLPAPARARYDDEDDYEDGDGDWAAYERPKRRESRAAGGIPEPTMGRAMGIVFVVFICTSIAGLPISLAMGAGPLGDGEPEVVLLASLIQLPIGFLVTAGVLCGMLPTTFPRACLVVVFEYLIVLAICVIIGVPLYVLARAAG